MSFAINFAKMYENASCRDGVCCEPCFQGNFNVFSQSLSFTQCPIIQRMFYHRTKPLKRAHMSPHTVSLLMTPVGKYEI